MNRPPALLSFFRDLPCRSTTLLAQDRSGIPAVSGRPCPARLPGSNVFWLAKVRSIRGATLHRLAARSFERYQSLPRKKEWWVTSEERAALIEKCVRRVTRSRDRDLFRQVLTDLVANNAIPADLLKDLPLRAQEAGKTRFDQVYEACMFLAFPPYRASLMDKMFGPDPPEKLRLWRVILPREFELSHVVVRAQSFQEAFALACDYACRTTLWEKRRIPEDLTIRVHYMSDRSVSQLVGVRQAVRAASRKTGSLPGRKYSPKDIMGARLVAIGRKSSGSYEIFKYAEARDIKRVLETPGLVRTSAVEVETFRPKKPRQP